MNRYFIITFSFLPLLVICGVAALFVFKPGDTAASNASGVERDMELYLELREKLIEHYDGELDEDALRNAALKGLAEGTGDRFTRVLTPLQARTQDLDLDGGFFGIGVTVDFNEDGSLRIDNVVPFGGADKAGLRVDDVIIAVDDVSILGQPSDASRERIRSKEENSVVKLGIVRGGNPAAGSDVRGRRLDVEVQRSRVESWSVHDVHIEERGGKRIGYLHISDFMANTYQQFEDAVNSLSEDGAQGLIIGLRANGGGRVGSSVDVVDSLIAEKDVLISFTRSTRESNRVYDRALRTQDETAITDLPLVVLMDDSSASAAELVAGALKDHGLAYVVGTRSFGKGLVQSIFRLSTDPRYAVNITTTQYFTPLGRQVQGSEGVRGGIQPDLLIEYKNGEKSRVHARLQVRRARYSIEEAMKSEWWNYEDRMLNAALDVLAGVPAVVK